MISPADDVTSAVHAAGGGHARYVATPLRDIGTDVRFTVDTIFFVTE